MATPTLSPPTARNERLGDVLSKVMRAWMRLGRADARQMGLSWPQLVLLLCLYKYGELRPKQWSDIVGASPAAATGLLDSLESGGYIRRTHDTGDRRLVNVALTAKGRRLSERVRDARVRELRSFCDAIPARTFDATVSTLETLAEWLSTQADASGSEE